MKHFLTAACVISLLLSTVVHKYDDVFLHCRHESKALCRRLVFVARVIRPGHPAKRDKDVRRAMRSRCARCPGLMTRATIFLRVRQYVTVFMKSCTKPPRIVMTVYLIQIGLR